MSLPRTLSHPLRLAGALRSLSTRRPLHTAIASASASTRLPRTAAPTSTRRAAAPRSARAYSAASADYPAPPPSPQPGASKQYSFDEVRVLPSSHTLSLRPRCSRVSALAHHATHCTQIHALTTKTPRGDASAAAASSSSSPLLIDVREPAEYAAGHIPGARNMPVSSAPEALHLPAEEFEERFGFAKPGADGGDVVFYCKAGVRSRAAAGMAVMAGWSGVGEYKGSWAEWSRRGGESER